MEDDPSSWVPVTHMGAPDGALVTVATWGESQHIQDFSVSNCAFQTNIKTHPHTTTTLGYRILLVQSCTLIHPALVCLQGTGCATWVDGRRSLLHGGPSSDCSMETTLPQAWAVAETGSSMWVFASTPQMD